MRRLAAAAMVMALGSAACGGPEEAAAAGVVSATDGGAVTSDDGAAVLEVPGGALEVDAGITVTAVAPPAALAEHDDLEVLGYYDLQPSGLTFSEPATLRLTVPADDVDGVPIVAVLLSGDAGVEQPAEVTVEATEAGLTITAAVDHFSEFGVVTANGRQYGGVVTGSMRPGRVVLPVGSEFTARVDVTNAGYGPREAIATGSVAEKGSRLGSYTLRFLCQSPGPGTFGLRFQETRYVMRKKLDVRDGELLEAIARFVSGDFTLQTQHEDVSVPVRVTILSLVGRATCTEPAPSESPTREVFEPPDPEEADDSEVLADGTVVEPPPTSPSPAASASPSPSPSASPKASPSPSASPKASPSPSPSPKASPSPGPTPTPTPSATPTRTATSKSSSEQMGSNGLPPCPDPGQSYSLWFDVFIPEDSTNTRHTISASSRPICPGTTETEDAALIERGDGDPNGGSYPTPNPPAGRKTYRVYLTIGKAPDSGAAGGQTPSFTITVHFTTASE